MIVGENMRFIGTIEGDEDLIVRGRVEGNVRIAGALTVEPGGLVAGDVSARAASVYGAVHGNVTAREAIEVARTGQLVGDCAAPRVAIVPGAAFRGRIEMSPDAEPPAAIPSTPVERRALPRSIAPPAREAPARSPRAVPRLATPARGPLRRRPER